MYKNSWFTLARHDEPVTEAQAEQFLAEAIAETQTAPVTGAQTDAAKAVGANGFPENTPISEMSAAEQAAYWKHQSRKHESRFTSLGLKDGELDQLRQAAARLLEIEEANRSDQERAVSEAEKRGVASATAAMGERLARAELRAAAAAAKIPNVEDVLDVVDLKRFVGSDGEPNTELIQAVVEKFSRLAPPAPEAPKPNPDLLQGVRKTDVQNFRDASDDEVRAELAKYGVKPTR